MSFCALAAIAWKCNVPIDKVEQDLIGLIPKYNKGATRQIKEKEVQHALRMYNEKAMLTPRERLEDWIGWEYRPIKRNGRKRAEHIRIMNFVRDEINGNTNWRNKEGRPTKKVQIATYRADHPDATKAQCHRDTGMSRDTIRRWWDA